ncbi:DUF4419 domain-containing protein [Kordia algicida OT-1]|uniref:Uncharacterized protein n=1 Tax=Kordia algicida OT-1 TaxID=391587 RepID=A9DJI7_9FLAO|nr:DUF4419 domain-containing protein [Kordia algicida]EDP98110.1 hypothetical protein KAOT1_12872 [Kordia algicida OT-1]
MITTKTKDSITFHIETLERPDDLVDEKAFSEIAQTFSSKIEYLPNPDEKLIAGGSHAFLYGLYLAYSQHRPFTLSPDMIWLLVLQGISNHVNFSYQAKENLFPQLTNKQTITIESNNIFLGDPESPWHETTAQFTNQIEKIVGSEIIADLRADFSTTTLASKVVSEITIMDAFKSYFDYDIAVCVCGIPELKLEGSATDWNRMLDKLEILKKYDMEWWYEDLKPIITKIKDTAEEIIDNEFWMHIFKVHTTEEYGNPKSVDGWITKFFPFDNIGYRIDLRKIKGYGIDDLFEKLPKQIVTVNFRHLLYDLQGNLLEETAMEYLGGFVGISQHHETQFLKPEINWIIGHQTKETITDKKEIDKNRLPSKAFHNIKMIPEEVFDVNEWEYLHLGFTNKVVISERAKELKFEHLTISGEINSETIRRLESYFDWTKKFITVNDKRLGEDRFSSEEYQEYIQQIKQKYVPKTGKSNYVQGEMMRTVEKLEEEAIQHQNKNYTKICHGRLASFLDKYLYDEDVFIEIHLTEILLTLERFKNKNRSLKEIQDHGYSLAYEYKYIKERIVEWHLHYGPTKLEEDPKLCL